MPEFVSPAPIRDGFQRFAECVLDHIAHPSVQSVPAFHSATARACRIAFGAALVTVWDNNQYGDMLVYQTGDPVLGDDLLTTYTMHPTESVTGMALQRNDVVHLDDLRNLPDGRAMMNPQVIDRYGLTDLISVPVHSPFDLQIIHSVVNVWFTGKPGFAVASRRAETDWLVRMLGLHLDYMLQRTKEDIRRAVGKGIAAASGVSGLLDRAYRVLRDKVRCDMSALYSWDAANGVLVLEQARDWQSGNQNGLASTDADPAALAPTDWLVSECVDRRRLAVLRQAVGEDAAPKVEHSFDRLPEIAAPLLSEAGEVLGVLRCRIDQNRPMPRSFAADDLHLLEAFARSMAPAVEQFLRIRTGSALAKVMEVVAGCVARMSGVDEVLQGTIEACAAALKAQFGWVYVVERDEDTPPRLLLRAAIGDDRARELIGKAWYGLGEGLTGHIAEGNVLRLRTRAEVVNHPRYAGKYAGSAGLLPQNYAGFLGVPIRLGNDILGVWILEGLQAIDDHPDPYFTDADVQTAEVLSTFLAYIIASDQYRATARAEFAILAQAVVDTEAAITPEEAGFAVMALLEDSGWPNAMLSLYDPQSRHVRALLSSGKTWNSIVSVTDRDIDGDDILALVLRNNTAEFIPDSTKDARCDPVATALAGLKAQYVLPLRVRDELIGTLQVDMGDKAAVGADEQLVLQALASHLAVAISRIRSQTAQLETTEQVLASSRFIVAETLASEAIHSLGHSVDEMLLQLAKDVQRREVRDHRIVLETLESWMKKLRTAQENLHNALSFVRAKRPDADVRTDVHDAIQKAVDLWYPMLSKNRCAIRKRAQAEHHVCKIPFQSICEVLSVLLVNSVQAHARNIEISTRNEADLRVSPELFLSDALVMEVSDDGVGVPPGDAPSLFLPTYTTKHPEFGTGLGLYIARRIARRVGGDVQLVVHAQGSRGATFMVVLPVDRKPNAEDAQ